MELTKNEKVIIHDKEFLITKIALIKKIELLFEKVRKVLNNSINISKYKFPSNIDIKHGKIFRGENYNSLPYVMLDYPKYFSGDDVFAFRTMFWWGNFFSSTLHLEGKSLNKYKELLFRNYTSLINENVYICVNDNPWQYHFDRSNYVLLTEENKNLLTNSSFIKLSKRFSLDDFNKLPFLVNKYFSTLLKLLSD